MMELLVLSLGGGLGAIARFLVDSAVHRCNGTGFPLGTIVINATGSFFVGLVTGMVSAGALDTGAARFLTMGVLGGYTTFSTACVETARLFQGGKRRAAVLHAGGMAVLSVACSFAGVAVAGALH